MTTAPTSTTSRGPAPAAPARRDQGHEGPGYLRFGAMIATSTVVMYLLTYTNSSEVLGHAEFSLERLYMALLMGGAMTVIMLGFMWKMYRDTRINLAIVAGGIIVALAGLGLSRGQVLVHDTAWMKAMIPHHSIAILTSERAGIEDLRVRRLADEIIAAQRREIREMQWLLGDIAANGKATTEDEAADRAVPEFSGAATAN